MNNAIFRSTLKRIRDMQRDPAMKGHVAAEIELSALEWKQIAQLIGAELKRQSKESK